MPQKIQAKLHDGTILEFPEGTSDEVIDKAVQTHLSGMRDVTTTAPKDAVTAQPKMATGSEKAAKVLGPIASVAAGTAVGLGTKSPTLGNLTMSAIDNLLKEQEEGYIDDPILNTAIDFGLNEIGARAFEKVVKLGRGAYKAGQELTGFGKGLENTAVDTDFLKLRPTFSQMEPEGFKKTISNIIENIFAPSNKKGALEASARYVRDEGEEFVKNLTGRADVKLNAPVKLATEIQSQTQKQFTSSIVESNKRGEAAKLIAEVNPTVIKKEISPATEKPSGLFNSDGTPRMFTVPAETEDVVIKGPVSLEKTITKAKSLLDEMNQSAIKPDPENPVVKALTDLINTTHAKFDPKTGALIYHEPIAFGDAWKTKQVADRIGYGGMDVTTRDIKDVRFKQIAQAINEDIDLSLPNWKNMGDKAKSLWQEAKGIVAKRNEIFTPGGEAGKSLETLLNTTTTPVDSVNAIIDDPTKLRRALNSGKLQIPTNSGFKYITSNTRKDLQGYELMRLMNDARTVDPKDPTKFIFDANKLYSNWTDASKSESYKMLFGQKNRADIDQFFKNVSAVSDKFNQANVSRYLMVRLGLDGVALGAGIAGFMTGGDLTSSVLRSGTVLGATITAHGLGKLMTNPSTARLMVALGQGAPLGMSTNLASRLISQALRNTPITLKTSQGDLQGKLNSEGRFEVAGAPGNEIKVKQ